MKVKFEICFLTLNFDFNNFRLFLRECWHIGGRGCWAILMRSTSPLPTRITATRSNSPTPETGGRRGSRLQDQNHRHLHCQARQIQVRLNNTTCNLKLHCNFYLGNNCKEGGGRESVTLMDNQSNFSQVICSLVIRSLCWVVFYF